MKWCVVMLALSIASAGCTSAGLERATLGQAESLSDLRYKQVMENLAILADQPDRLPAFSLIFFGTTDVTDTAQLQTVPVWTRAFTKAPLTRTTFSENLDVSASRTVKDNWTLDPVTAPEKLKALRAACWWMIYGPDYLDPSSHQILSQWQPDCHGPPGHYFDVATKLAAIRRGWLHIDQCNHPPHDACYVGHCHHTYVWVNQDGFESLTQFTLVLQEIERMIVNDVYHPHPGITLAYKVDHVPASFNTLLPTHDPKDDPQIEAVATVTLNQAGRLATMKRRLENIQSSDPKLHSQIQATKTP